MTLTLISAAIQMVTVLFQFLITPQGQKVVERWLADTEKMNARIEAGWNKAMVDLKANDPFKWLRDVK